MTMNSPWTLLLTTIALISVGSNSKVHYRSYRVPTTMMVLVVEGSLDTNGYMGHVHLARRMRSEY